MPKYNVSKTSYFRELGYKVQAGQEVELTVEQAEVIMKADPGILGKPKMTTQSAKVQTRTAAPKKKKTTTKK